MGAEEPTWRGGGRGGEEGAALLLAVALRLRAHGRLIDGLGLVAGGEGRHAVVSRLGSRLVDHGQADAECVWNRRNILMRSAAFVAKEAARLGSPLTSPLPTPPVAASALSLLRLRSNCYPC